MQNWFSADYHLGHDNIRKYVNRPFKSLKLMNETIIRNHNQRVKKDDLFIHDGDFCFYSKSKHGEGEGVKAEEYIKQLNGKHIFIIGNHDRNNSLKSKIQHLVLQGPGYQIKVVHKPIHANPSYPLNIVGHVHNAWKIKSFKDYYKWQISESQRTDLPNHYINSCKQFVERWKHHNKDSCLLNVGVDVHQFRPISFEEVIGMYNKWKKENT